MLSNKQLKEYHDDGYTVVRHVLSAEEISELRRVTEEICESARGITQHTAALDLEPTHSPENPRVRRIKHPQHVHPLYAELARHNAVLGALKPILGDSIRLRSGCKINLKYPNYGSAVEWHQDWAFYPHTNQSVLAVGILLDDMDIRSGPILFVNGSHRGPIYSHHSQGAFCGGIDVVEEEVDVSAATEIVGKAGDMTIHHARLVHGSGPNVSNAPRRVIFFEYTAADAWPLAGVETIDLEEFNSRVLCGEPTLQPRLESVPVRLPLPVAPFQGSIYENQRTLKHRYFEDA